MSPQNTTIITSYTPSTHIGDCALKYVCHRCTTHPVCLLPLAIMPPREHFWQYFLCSWPNHNNTVETYINILLHNKDLELVSRS